jgi:hypothetical protein
MCGSVCQTSYQFELEENLFLERIVTYDLWQVMGALFYSRVKVAQHGMASQRISTTQKIQETAVR